MKNFIAKTAAFLKQMLSEDNGNVSSMRFNVTATAAQWSLAVTFSLVWTTIKHPELLPALIPAVVAGIAGLLGVKAYQKSKESKNPAQG